MLLFQYASCSRILIFKGIFIFWAIIILPFIFIPPNLNSFNTTLSLDFSGECYKAKLITLYIPDTNYTGLGSLRVRANDGIAGSNTLHISVII